MSHNEPIAWAVLLADGDRIYDVYAIEEEAKAIDEVVTGNHGIVPLYRSPALTDEEREAIELAIETWVCKPQLKATLRGLLERTK
jgi:predicted DNA binding protein